MLISYLLISFCFWFVGFCISYFNQYNILVGDLSSMNARLGWLPSKFILPLLYRILSWTFWVASLATLYFADALTLHWFFILLLTIILFFISALVANVCAWKSLARNHPLAFERYKIKQDIKNML